MGRQLSLWCYYVFVLGAFIVDLVNCSRAQQTSRFSAYEVTVPKQIARQRRDLDNQDTGEMSYTIQAQGSEHVLVLKRNKLLLHRNFTVYTYDPNSSLISERPDMQNHCHYKGYVEDVEFSSVSVSLCSGLNGFLNIGNARLGIEPLEGSSDFEHVVFRLEDEETEPLLYRTHHHDDNNISPDQTIVHSHSDIPEHPDSHSLRRRRAVMQQTHYVELIIVVDKKTYVALESNAARVQHHMIQVANRLDSMYEQLNVRVVLVGMEIWTAGNLITVDGENPGSVLTNFWKWRRNNLLPRHYHDNAQFVVNEQLSGGRTLGFGSMSTMCSSKSAAISTHAHVSCLSWTMAHEIGHNLGMRHDPKDCYCSAEECVMYALGKCGSSCDDNVFSDCSVDSFQKFMVRLDNRNCLLNMPQSQDIYTPPYCGNNWLDPGEECDCGSEEECKKDPCCEPNTCKLKSGAQCADGECCRNCKFLPGGYECRSRSGECDLPEYCNGSSAVCQADVFVQDGYLCRNNQSYCYSGKCHHHDDQCKALFGSQAKSAADICYLFVNRVENCGGNKECLIRNGKCGKLQCDDVNPASTIGRPGRTIVTTTTIGQNKCWGMKSMMGPDVPDPGMVNNGTKCGENGVCLNQKCRDVSELKHGCDTQGTCLGHGVCNSNRNCHCDYGWAPPFCKEEGYGGSIDSGPGEMTPYCDDA